jgi:hypothetical protein
VTAITDAEDHLTLGELLVLVAVAGVALLGAVSLTLAIVGAHALLPVLGLTLVIALGLTIPVMLRWRPTIRVDGIELAALAATVIVAGVMFLPGFPYAAGDKDPGVYVIHGMAIAREGSTQFTDEVASRDDGRIPVQYFGPGSRFPGLWSSEHSPGEVLPQFYHLFPALLATAHEVGGPSAVFHLNPLLGVVVAAATLLATRRAFGWATAGVAVALLCTNMLQVWQAKYPSTEIITQLFVIGAVLAVLVAIDTGWRPAAALAGFLVGCAWLARPDGFLVVLLAVGVLASLVAFRRFDARAWWFSAGLAVSAPLVFFQAYSFNSVYSYTTEVPKPAVFTAAVVFLVGAGAVGRVLLPRLGALLGDRRQWLSDHVQVILGGAIVALTVVVLVVAWNREAWFGVDMLNRNGELIRSYDEQNLLRLSWFFTVPGLLLMVGGVAVTGLQRWRANRWVLVAPGLAILPVYLWAARISPQMMWWGRRFIPMVIIPMVVLIAAAIGWLLRGSGARALPRQLVGVALAGFLTLTYLGQSWPLHAHREFAGSYDYVTAIGDAAGDEQGVFLWQYPGGNLFDPARTYAGPLWFVDGQISALLPKEQPNDPWIDAYLEEFGDEHEVFVVTRGLELPEGFDPERLELVTTLHQEMPYWEESKISRPDESMADKGAALFFDVQVWRVTGPSTAQPTDNPAVGEDAVQ